MICVLFLLNAATGLSVRAQIFKTLAEFNGANGANPPFGELTQGPDGAFYGTTFYGGNGPCSSINGVGCGTVYRITRTGTITLLHSFSAMSDGYYPATGLTLALDGYFYGTTSAGGANNEGTVFKISSKGGLTTLYNFCSEPGCADGMFPFSAGLIQGNDGAFYGATPSGGEGYGTIFKMTPAGNITTLHSFNFTDGSTPLGTLLEDTDGKLYGTTYEGGSQNQGTIYRITTGGAFSTLYEFNLNDGAGPHGGLARGSDHALYGATMFGGSCCGNDGTVFKFSQGGFVLLQSLNGTDGENPCDALLQATDGNFYATTELGGSNGLGEVFRIAPGGDLTVLHSFDVSDGNGPVAGLVQGTDGSFYGTTSDGGDLNCNAGNGCGTVFNLSTGLTPFVAFIHSAGKVGQTGGILGQGFTGTTSVTLNGVPANFTVVSDTFIEATIPPGATTGYVTVTTRTRVLTSNVPFQVIQ